MAYTVGYCYDCGVLLFEPDGMEECPCCKRKFNQDADSGKLDRFEFEKERGWVVIQNLSDW